VKRAGLTWIGENYESAESAEYVGRSESDALGLAEQRGVPMVRIMRPGLNYTFEHRAGRLSLFVVDGIVQFAAFC
jgi:hypothetical protein